MARIKAEYIWIDGIEPTALVRSKTKILIGTEGTVPNFPKWGFDGSSTNQAVGNDSDCILNPVSFRINPLNDDGFLVLCEVLNSDETPHKSNKRAKLRIVQDQFKDYECWFGFEQEYTLMKGGRPYGWPKNGYPPAQGQFYCGVGADNVYGRELIESHLDACIIAELSIEGINAEVMPGQWEFQIGAGLGLKMCDDLIYARWLLYRIGEAYDISVTLHPKPIKGDWNGAGMHTNFSTNGMRRQGGYEHIENAIKKLEHNHTTIVEVYGADNHERLTGNHETCGIDEFKSGVADRGASIRIPRHVASQQYGYLEDRRPAANADPYEVARALMVTICD